MADEEPIFPDLSKSMLANPDEMLAAMREGVMTVGVDIARDGTETHVEGYWDPQTKRLTITDEYIVPATVPKQ